MRARITIPTSMGVESECCFPPLVIRPNPDLYVKHVLGTAVTQLTSDPSSDIHPMLSPDGTRVAFASDRSGNWGHLDHRDQRAAADSSDPKSRR